MNNPKNEKHPPTGEIFQPSPSLCSHQRKKKMASAGPEEFGKKKRVRFQERSAYVVSDDGAPPFYMTQPRQKLSPGELWLRRLKLCQRPQASKEDRAWARSVIKLHESRWVPENVRNPEEIEGEAAKSPTPVLKYWVVSPENRRLPSRKRSARAKYYEDHGFYPEEAGTGHALDVAWERHLERQLRKPWPPTTKWEIATMSGGDSEAETAKVVQEAWLNFLGRKFCD